MAMSTKIQWCDATFNPWRGCTKVSDGCKHCYADAQSKRNPGTLGIWGPNGTRVVAADAQWRAIERLNKEAGVSAGWKKAAGGTPNRPRVFVGSLMDVFEDWDGPMTQAHGVRLRLYKCEHGESWVEDDDSGMYQSCDLLTMSDVRRRSFTLIDACRNLDFLLVTKRPENIRRMWPDTDCEHCGEVSCGVHRAGVLDRQFRENVWLITSAEDQEQADKRIPELLKCRDLAPVLGVSAEPLLGPIDFTANCITPAQYSCGFDGPYWFDGYAGVDWIIVGGESGFKARPCNAEWIRSIREQCQSADVACFVKQLGSRPILRNRPPRSFDKRTGTAINVFNDSKGGDPAEWPQDLRVREFPKQ